MPQPLDDFPHLQRPVSTHRLRQLRRSLIGAALVLGAVLSAVMLWSVWRDYTDTLEHSRRQAATLSRALEEHSRRSFVSALQTVENIVEEANRRGGFESMDEYSLHLLMKAKISSIPQIRGLVAVSPNGVLYSHGLEYPTRPISVAKRDYFQYHRDHTDMHPFLGKPVISLSDGKWVLPLTMRVNRVDGGFAGLMLLGMEPRYFADFYQSLQLPSNTLVTLIHANGVLTIRYPWQDKELGKKTPPSPLLQQIMSQNSGEAEGQLLDATPRLIAWRKMETPPLTIVAALSRDEALRRWQDSAQNLAGIWLLAMLALAGTLALLLQQLRRLQRSESRLFLTQFSVDHAAELICWVDSRGRLAYANATLSQRTGLHAGDLWQLPLWRLGLCQNEAHWRQLWQESQRNGGCRFEAVLQLGPSSSLPVEVSLQPMQDEKHDYYSLTAWDISERKRHEAELLQHRDHLQIVVTNRTAELQAILDASPLGISLTIDHNIHYVNHRLLTMLGYTAAELEGQRGSSLLAQPQQLNQQYPDYYARLANDEILRGEFELLRRDGGVFWASFSSKALVKGAPTLGVITMLEDISERKASESALLAAKDAAEKANLAKSNFLASMSHELRTPMHAILSYSEMGLDKADSADRQQLRRYFERIRQSGARLLGLLNDLLDMAKLEAGKMTYQYVRQDLLLALNAASQELRPLLTVKQLTLRLQIEQPLWAEYDYRRMVQVFVNLLGNAIKYSPQGGSIEIDGGYRQRDNRRELWLSVHDQGPGIADHELDSIFEKFKQGTGNEHAQGSGLGLAISQQIIHDHQGQISAGNHLAGGAVFTLALAAA